MVKRMIGYKATDKDMKCRGFQFELGKWYEVEGEVKLCENGFHFCDYPSGVWGYYSAPGTRIFEVEAEDVLDTEVEPGTSNKRVAKRIRLVKEVSFDGNRNTGDSNTGDCNTGDCNTGHYNTGHYNTGNGNTGDCNTGHYNTGHYNTGDSNTGNRNTGHRNTGHRNTGHCNTGHYNATNRSSGVFCVNEPTVISFDVDSGLLWDDFFNKYPESGELGKLIQKDDPIDFEPFKNIPGITPEKLKALHDKHIAGRKK